MSHVPNINNSESSGNENTLSDGLAPESSEGLNMDDLLKDNGSDSSESEGVSGDESETETPETQCSILSEELSKT